MFNKEQILEKIFSKEVYDKLSSYDLCSVVLFGSIVTDEFNEYSDIDIAIIGKESYELDTILNLEMFFESLLKREIDVVDLKSSNLDFFVKVSILNSYKEVFSIDNNLELNKYYNEIDKIYKENENFFHFRKVDLLS
ncbi:MAG: nucleotidyltransferase domain-containing protein [Clostridium sp.]